MKNNTGAMPPNATFFSCSEFSTSTSTPLVSSSEDSSSDESCATMFSSDALETSDFERPCESGTTLSFSTASETPLLSSHADGIDSNINDEEIGEFLMEAFADPPTDSFDFSDVMF